MTKQESKFFPFDKPLVRDVVFYFFLFSSYVILRRDLEAIIDYNYGNPVVQIAEAIVQALVLSWIYSLILCSIRRYFRNRSERVKNIKSKQQTIKENPRMTITKFDKPIGKMTPEEMRSSAQKMLEEFLKDQKEK